MQIEGSGFWRAVAGVLAALLLATLALLVRTGGPAPPAFDPEDLRRPELVRVDRLRLSHSSFDDLPGWPEDRVQEALPALQGSCRVLLAWAPEHEIGEGAVAGTAADWHPLCRQLEGIAAEAGRELIAAWLEESFVPWQVSNQGARRGLFTGYYEPSLRGSRRRHGVYTVPLYRRPGELVSVDLGRFREDLAGRRIAGRLEESRLLPYYDRREIDAGAIASRRLELVWVDDVVDAFFLQIQGSGRVQLAEGGEMRVGYSGQNGHRYFAIGRELIDRGAIPREKISMQSIREWLEQNPDEALEVLQLNASYVFFRDLGAEGPLGTLGVPVTPGRSLAVDRRFLPLGAPLWLDSTRPVPFREGEIEPLQRLVVAQDTGGAIRGPVRGDVFWGHGEEAAEVAGRMKQTGRLWLLLPRGVQPPAELLP